jgi:hypothetical protein
MLDDNSRRELLKLARAMLNGELSYLEGAPRVLKLRSRVIGDADITSDLAFGIFSLISSETDHLPLQEQRVLWASESLAKLEEKIILSEEWARPIGIKACENLIERFDVT